MSDMSFEGKRILYLEDEPLIAFDTSENLSDMGFADVTTVYRLDEAISRSEQGNFDIALLDINVDCGRTSFDLGKTLRDKGVSVIYASGNSSDCQRLRAEGYHFVGKPVLASDLETTLKAALDLQQNADAA